MSNAAVWTWFGIAWVFLAAVALSRWRDREHRDQAATEKALENTRHNTSHQYEMDAL